MERARLASVFARVMAAAGVSGLIAGCFCPSGGWDVETIKLVDASTDAACEVCGEAGACSEISTDAGPAVICHYGEALGDCGGSGRRPPGLRVRPERRAATALGAYFARVSYLEAASVDAFAILARELGELGAPPSLARSAHAAGRDEVRHARATSALARRFGGRPRAPSVAPAQPRSRAAIARENAVEGCVRETWGALVAGWQARVAGDAAVRAVMRRIAADEARHAALAWRVQRWAEPSLDDAARRRVSAARSRAVEALMAGVTAPVHPELVRVAGLPAPPHATRLAEGLRRALWS